MQIFLIANKQNQNQQNQSWQSQAQRGFTLIELLVVVFIIGILLSNVSLVPHSKNTLPDQLSQLDSKLAYALDYATFNQQVLGLYISPTGYTFFSYDDTYATQSFIQTGATNTWLPTNIIELKSNAWVDLEKIVLIDLIADDQSILIEEPVADEPILPQIIILPNYEFTNFLLSLTNNGNQTFVLDFEDRVF